MSSILDFDPSHFRQITAMLGRAFAEDPMASYLIPDSRQRPRAIPRFMAGCVRYGMRYGRVETTEDLSGLAVWIPHEYTNMTPWRMLRSGMLWGPLSLGLGPLQRLMKAARFIDQLHEEAVSEPHWYLFVLAVDPQRQRTGIGGRLIGHGLARADADKLPCRLETTHGANVAYYQRHGFEAVAHAEVPGAGIEVWTMVRKPKS